MLAPGLGAKDQSQPKDEGPGTKDRRPHGSDGR